MRTRLGLKVFGLSALVMGTMAIGSAGVAQAEAGACWGYINPTTKVLSCFSATLEAETKIEIENKTATLLIKNKNLEILCTGAKWINGGQLAANGSILPGQLEFSGCKTLQITPELKVLPACEPKAGGTKAGVIVTEKGDGLIVLHKLADGKLDQVVLLLPVTGKVLAKIELGELCGAGEEVIIEGHLVLTDCKGLFSTHAVTHLLEEFKALQKLTIGGVTIEVDGSVNISLAGTHSGFLWAGLAK